MSALLEVIALSKSFGGLQALSALSFSVRPGEILGLTAVAKDAGELAAASAVAHAARTPGVSAAESNLRKQMPARRSVATLRPISSIRISLNC